MLIHCVFLSISSLARLFRLLGLHFHVNDLTLEVHIRVVVLLDFDLKQLELFKLINLRELSLSINLFILFLHCLGLLIQCNILVLLLIKVLLPDLTAELSVQLEVKPLTVSHLVVQLAFPC